VGLGVTPSPGKGGRKMDDREQAWRELADRTKQMYWDAVMLTTLSDELMAKRECDNLRRVVKNLEKFMKIAEMQMFIRDNIRDPEIWKTTYEE
jgi:hypothetical protein